MTKKIKQIILLVGDIFFLYLSLYSTLLIRYQKLPDISIWSSHFESFSIIFIGWLIIFYISNLYNLHLAVNNSAFFQSAFKAMSISGLLSVVFFYLNQNIEIAPKTNLLIFVFVFALLFYIWRQLFNWFIKSHLTKNNIAIIGRGKEVEELVNELEKKPHLGYSVQFIVDEKHTEEKNINNIPILNNIEKLKDFVRDKKISIIILAENPYDSSNLRTALFNCLPLKIDIVNLANFYENITGKIPIGSINQMWFLENLSEGSKGFFDKIKRLYDFLLALLILLATGIFWPFIGIIIKIQSPGPIFFKQTRAGKNNKPFVMIKFRTMKTEDNDHSLTKKNDRRITKFGKFLRKSRIDEIPQVLNIIFGDMSFIGPRPERPELIHELAQNIPFYHERMLVKPGLTGPDQVSGEYHSPTREDTLKKLQYDLFYIKNRSLYLDMSIALKTIATMLGRGGV